MKKGKVLSLSIVGLGVEALSAYEIYYTPHDSITELVVCGALIQSIGLIRLLGFYKGPQLGLFSKKDSARAIGFSFFFSALYIGYAYMLTFWLQEPTMNPHQFLLFCMGILLVAFMEWIFSREMSYGEPTVVIEARKEIDRLMNELDSRDQSLAALIGRMRSVSEGYERVLIEQFDESVAYRKLEAKAYDLQEKVEEKEEELTRLEPLAEALQKIEGCRISINGKPFMVNADNGILTEAPSAATKVVCRKTGKTLYDRNLATKTEKPSRATA